jgi:predicted MFS family arabinose efflux permease
MATVLAATVASRWFVEPLYGLDWVATVPPTIALCNEVFGRDRATVVYGWVFAGHQLGAALAAWADGYTRQVTGSYQLSFLAAGALCLVAAVGTQHIRGREHEEPTPNPPSSPRAKAPLAHRPSHSDHE